MYRAVSGVKADLSREEHAQLRFQHADFSIDAEVAAQRFRSLDRAGARRASALRWMRRSADAGAAHGARSTASSSPAAPRSCRRCGPYSSSASAPPASSQAVSSSRSPRARADGAQSRRYRRHEILVPRTEGARLRPAGSRCPRSEASRSSSPRLRRMNAPGPRPARATISRHHRRPDGRKRPRRCAPASGGQEDSAHRHGERHGAAAPRPWRTRPRARVARPPGLIGAAEVEIAERAGDGDLADPSPARRAALLASSVFSAASTLPRCSAM